MQKIKYFDLHCDTLTKCLDAGENFFCGNLQASAQKLINSGARAQCFAIFTQGERAKAQFFRYLNFYKKQLRENGDILASVKNFKQYENAQKAGKLACLLTVENLGFIGKDLSIINQLKRQGVVMASLCWNFENALASPNMLYFNGVPSTKTINKKGLSPLGEKAVELLQENKILVDVSHLSYGGVENVLKIVKTPVVATHSNAYSICGVNRNLTDCQIKKIANSGGVIGVNYYYKFLGDGEIFERVLKHIKHLINTGGENCVALGSDFDGISPPCGLENAEKVPNLLLYIRERVRPRAFEKLSYKNFERVFKEVVG